MEELQRESLAQQVAHRLMSKILNGLFPPGQRLPSERELASLLSVTRTTIREAIKILQGLKLVTVRHGDGARVQDFLRTPSVEVLGELLFMGGDIDPDLLDQVLEARVLYGKTVAQLAAQRRSQQDIVDYATLLDRLKSATDTRLNETDLELFYVLARASGNLVFIFILNLIRHIYTRHTEVFAAAMDKEQLIRYHRDILKALERHDTALASSTAENMLESQRRSLMEVYNDKKGR